MASINYAAREISVKIVYYGPGLSGKTTNLQIIHRKVPQNFKSDMVSLATETDRTLFFDFLPLDLGKIKGFSAKFQLYTVPGQVYYNATRKLVLRGVDGIVFVADSAADKMDENLESFQNMEENLAEYGYKRESIPIIIQYNKRDLPNALPVDVLNSQMNRYNLPWSEASAIKGKGVFESLKLIGKTVIDELNKKYSRQPRTGAAPRPSAPPPPQQQARPAMAPPPPPPPPPPSARPMSERETQQFPHTEQWNQPRANPYGAPQQPAQRPQAPDMNYPQAHANPQPHAAPDQPGSPNYSDYDTIDLEPMSQPPERSSGAEQFGASQQADKTELDLEIERYQQEIRTGHATPPQGFPADRQPAQPHYEQPRYEPPQYDQQQFNQQPQYPQNQPYDQTSYGNTQGDQARYQTFDYYSDQNYQQYDYGSQGQNQNFNYERQQQPYADEHDEETFEIQQPPPPGYAPQQPPSYGQQPNYGGYQGQQYGYQQPQQHPGNGRAWGEQPAGGGDDQPMYFTSVNTDKQRKKGKKPVNPKNKPKKGLFGKLFNKEDEF